MITIHQQLLSKQFTVKKKIIIKFKDPVLTEKALFGLAQTTVSGQTIPTVIDSQTL
jgi:hypothetical protein